jgi:ATP-dependent helicase/nuclease subunit B
MVMAGLNEGAWPGAPDCGPWINRPMRDVLGMKQPECQIGQTAHDFVQAFGCSDVKLIWASASAIRLQPRRAGFTGCR